MPRWIMALLAVFVLTTGSPVLAQSEPAEGAEGAAVGAMPMVGAPTDLVAAVGAGVATKYWLRFMANSTPTLWLFVNNGWRQMNTPSAQVTDAVQEAFCGCTNPLEVFAGFSDGNLTYVVVRTP